MATTIGFIAGNFFYQALTGRHDWPFAAYVSFMQMLAVYGYYRALKRRGVTL